MLSDFEIGQRHDKNLEIAVAARFEKLSPAVDCEAQKTSEFLSLGDRQLVSWDDIPAGVDVTPPFYPIRGDGRDVITAAPPMSPVTKRAFVPSISTTSFSGASRDGCSIVTLNRFSGVCVL